MKNLILITTLVLTGSLQSRAQTSANATITNDKFIAAMEANLRILDTASGAATFITLANNFERIATAEKSKWQPYYFAAYCYAVMGVTTPDKTKIDMLADKAELYLHQAATIEKNNSEIATLFAMIKSSKILVDPMNRWQKLGAEVNAHLSEAKQLDPNNPRPWFIESRIKFNTPEGLGGGPKVAKELVTESIRLFKSFKPQNSIAPNWGLQQAEGFLEKLNK